MYQEVVDTFLLTGYWLTINLNHMKATQMKKITVFNKSQFSRLLVPADFLPLKTEAINKLLLKCSHKKSPLTKLHT